MNTALAIALIAFAADTVTLEERIDLFEPTTGAFLGAEQTWYGPDGRRLRLEVTDAEGVPTLLFFVRHDDRGREAEAIYFEGESVDPDREVFTYSDDGRLQTTTYFYEPGRAADRSESELDVTGRTIRKRYYRADGTQYGEEDVLWDDEGNKRGWDFRYVGRDGGTSFRYEYQAVDAAGAWVRRMRSRNGAPERMEVRTRIVTSVERVLPNPATFVPGDISSDRSEASPSFSRDGKIMVFARYDDDWTTKDPFIAYLEEDGWRVEPLASIGSVYNLAISPDGSTVLFATRSDDTRALFRIRRAAGWWSDPENLTEEYGIRGTYPSLTERGDLVFFDADGASGAGIYSALGDGDGFGEATPLFIPSSGDAFDAYPSNGYGTLLVTRCFDDVCASGPENGIWEVRVATSGMAEARRLPNLPYAWGAQPVEPLGLFVFTDGEDILALPLSVGSSR